MPMKSPETRRAYMQAWRARNPNKVLANSRRQANRQRLYRQENKERYAQWQRNWRANNPRECLVIAAKARAKKRGLPFSIVVADVDWVTHCPIFGLELDYCTTPTGERKNCKRDNFATIDRKEPALGYVPGNVFVLSYKANRLKQDLTLEVMERIAAYIKS